MKQRDRAWRGRMFVRMLWRAALVRRSRTITALAAMAIAATVATALLNLYTDAQRKLRAEFRGYGANLVVTAKDGGELGSKVVSELLASKEFRAVPYAYVIARTANDLRGAPVVVVGTEVAAAKAMNATWWRTSPVGGDLAMSTEIAGAMFGERAFKTLAHGSAPVELWFAGKSLSVLPLAALNTGGDEDDRIYVDLGALEKWTKVSATTVEIATDGTPEQIKATMARLRGQFPAANVQAIRQIVEGEANVLAKTRSTLLLATSIVVLTAALCVLATLLSWVLDRRRDFAVMKALGASQRLITAFFATEASLIGSLGALGGFALGVITAMAIGRASFHASVAPQFMLLPVMMAAGAGLALLAALAPMAMLRRIQPAAILKGE